MPGVAIETGLQLVDAGQVRQARFGTRPSLGDSRNCLRQIAVGVRDLNARNTKEDHDQHNRGPPPHLGKPQPRVDRDGELPETHTSIDRDRQLIDASPAAHETTGAATTLHSVGAQVRIVTPSVTAAQMREVDRIMVDELGISLLQMMENAGRALAELTRIHLGGFQGRRIVVLAGRGGNAGGGLSAARRLAVWGARVHVLMAHPEAELAEATRHQLAALRAMEVPVHNVAEAQAVLDGADDILDALLGYSLVGAPREPEAGLIRAANSIAVPILALDLPSGLDPDHGTPHDPTIRATRTMTLAVPKVGLLRPEAADWVGELWLADISVPPQVYSRLGIQVGTLFSESDLVRLS